MAPTTAFLAKFLGAYMVVMSAWLAARKDVALELVERVSRDAVGVTVIGMIRLTAGLAIVIGHDVWTGGTATLVTLVGWLILVSGLLTLFLPHHATASLVRRMRYADNTIVFALITLALGLALIVGGVAG